MKDTPTKSSPEPGGLFVLLAEDDIRYITVIHKINGGTLAGAGKSKVRHKLRIQRVNVDFTETMLFELDEMAEQLNISRQAVIKSLLRQVLDQHYLANKRAGR